MRRSIFLLFFLLGGVLFPQEAPKIRYQSVPDFLKLPKDIYFGEVAGVAVNSKGHVFVFSRGDTTGPAYGAAAAQLLEFDAGGEFIREIGHHLYAWSFAHSVKVDRDDNIWVADKGSDMVIEFNPEGRVAMVFGRKQEASDEGTEPLRHPKPPLPPVDGMFRQVTDMAWDAAGNTYISDGYINSRVAKIDKNGNWLKSWGDPGDGLAQFKTPHSIAIDGQAQRGASLAPPYRKELRRTKAARGAPFCASSSRGRVYVADRGNRRIQVFDGEGRFLRQIAIDVPVDPDAHPAIGAKPATTAGAMAPGAPWAICITPGANPVLFSSDAYPGRIYKLTLDGKVLGVLGESGKQLKQFGWIHEIACPSETELYVAELLNWRVQKLILEAPAPSGRP